MTILSRKLFVGLWCLFSCLGQTLEYDFRAYSAADGLTNTAILSLFQADDGYLWLGTYDSVMRFDGFEFSMPSPIDSLDPVRVRTLKQDADGRLWLATHRGVHIVENDDIHPLKGPGLENVSARDLVFDGEAVWVLTEDGLCRWTYEHTQWFGPEDGLPTGAMMRAFRTQSGEIWLGTTAGIYRFDGIGFQPLSHPLLDQRTVYGIAQDRNQRTWVATENGLFCVDGTKVSRFDERDGLGSSSVWCVAIGPHGSLWAGTDHGAFVSNLESSRPYFKRVSQTHDVGFTTIYAIMPDREGCLWFGTCTGLYQLHHPALQNYATTPHAQPYFSLLWENEASMWLASNQGVENISPDNPQNPPQSFLKDQFVRCMAQGPNHEIWFGTREGLFKGPAGNIVFKEKDGLPDNHIMGLLWDHREILQIATLRGGLAELKNDAISPHPAQKSLPSKRLYRLFEDRNKQLWVGTDNGAARLEGDSFRSISETQGIDVYDFTQDQRGRIWIATARGLFRFTNDTVSAVSPQSGFGAEPCFFVTEDQSGSIWIGTKRGVAQFNGSQFTFFDTQHGLPYNEMNIAARLIDPHGRIWFGHYRGVSVIDPSRLLDHMQPPQIELKQHQVFDRQIDFSMPSSFSHRENEHSFSFLALNYPAPGSIRYRYKLQGWHQEWQETKDRQVRISNLPPGKYQFAVTATRDGMTSANPAQASFVIEPPLWLQWWVRPTFALLFLALVGWQLWVLRVRNTALRQTETFLRVQMEKEVAEKERQDAEIRVLQSQMNPHFLQNAFTNAIHFVHTSPEKGELILRKLSTMFRKSMDRMGQVWVPLKQEIGFLDDYLQIQKLRFDERLTCQVKCDRELLNRKVPALMIQPLVENAITHGFKQVMQLSVQILVTQMEKELCVEVLNNGIELENPIETYIRPGHALHNLNQRLELLGNPPFHYRFENGHHHFQVKVKENDDEINPN